MKLNLFTPVALIRKAGIPLLLSMLMMSFPRAGAQSLTPEFEAAGYTLTDLGSIENLPAQYGGLTIRPAEPNMLYIGGNANISSGKKLAISRSIPLAVTAIACNSLALIP